jgi:hypothetical protein
MLIDFSSDIIPILVFNINRDMFPYEYFVAYFVVRNRKTQLDFEQRMKVIAIALLIIKNKIGQAGVEKIFSHQIRSARKA